MLLELFFLGCVCISQKYFKSNQNEALYNDARHFGHQDFQSQPQNFFVELFSSHYILVLHAQILKRNLIIDQLALLLFFLTAVYIL